MKILHDENLAHRLRGNLGAHEVFSVSYKGWAGLTERTIAIVALSSVEWDILKHHLRFIAAAIVNAVPGSFQAIDCGMFTRKK